MAHENGAHRPRFHFFVHNAPIADPPEQAGSSSRFPG
jgi:hypothetical protein